MIDHRLGEGPAGDLLASAGKATPPIAVSASMLGGLSLEDWVLIATLAYTVLQIAWLGYKAWRSHQPGGRFSDDDHA